MSYHIGLSMLLGVYSATLVQAEIGEILSFPDNKCMSILEITKIVSFLRNL